MLVKPSKKQNVVGNMNFKMACACTECDQKQMHCEFYKGHSYYFIMMTRACHVTPIDSGAHCKEFHQFKHQCESSINLLLLFSLKLFCFWQLQSCTLLQMFALCLFDDNYSKIPAFLTIPWGVPFTYPIRHPSNFLICIMGKITNTANSIDFNKLQLHLSGMLQKQNQHRVNQQH